MRLVPVLLGAALLAGCAERAGPGGAPDSPVTGTPVPGPETGALEVSPRDGLVDLRPQPWQTAEPAGPRRVRVEFYGGVEACEGLARVRTEYSQQAVTITLFVGRVPEAAVCIEIAVLKATTVGLAEPLGGRAIVDGAGR